jgi:hypothetical protein
VGGGGTTPRKTHSVTSVPAHPAQRTHNCRRDRAWCAGKRGWHSTPFAPAHGEGFGGQQLPAAWSWLAAGSPHHAPAAAALPTRKHSPRRHHRRQLRPRRRRLDDASPPRPAARGRCCLRLQTTHTHTHTIHRTHVNAKAARAADMYALSRLDPTPPWLRQRAHSRDCDVSILHKRAAAASAARAMEVRSHPHSHTHTLTYTRTHTRTCTQTHAQTHTQKHTHTRICTHAHAFIHTPSQTLHSLRPQQQKPAGSQQTRTCGAVGPLGWRH